MLSSANSPHTKRHGALYPQKLQVKPCTTHETVVLWHRGLRNLAWSSIIHLARLLSSVPPLIGHLIGLNQVRRAKINTYNPCSHKPLYAATSLQTFAVLPESYLFCFQLSSLLLIVRGKEEKDKFSKVVRQCQQNEKKTLAQENRIRIYIYIHVCVCVCIVYIYIYICTYMLHVRLCVHIEGGEARRAKQDITGHDGHDRAKTGWQARKTINQAPALTRERERERKQVHP